MIYLYRGIRLSPEINAHELDSLTNQDMAAIGELMADSNRRLRDATLCLEDGWHCIVCNKVVAPIEDAIDRVLTPIQFVKSALRLHTCAVERML